MAVLDRVLPIFKASAAGLQVLITSHRGHALELVRAADLSRVRGLIIIGGDGTANEVITGGMENPFTLGGWPNDLPVGIIPCGTDGTLAKFISKTNVVDAAQVMSPPRRAEL